MFKHLLRKKGILSVYKKDQNGIINRYIQEQQSWNIHIENTKKYIIKNIPVNKVNSIAVLGSGWLLDVPVSKLTDNSKKLFLIDINHPRAIKNKYKSNSKIEFIEFDLTFGMVNLIDKSKSFKEFMSKANKIAPSPILNSYDYIISVNILNQLDIILCDIIKQRFAVSESELSELRKLIQLNHINSLPLNKSCLITDYKEINYSKKNKDKEVRQLIYTDLTRFNNIQEWIWNFDTHKTYCSKQYTDFSVIAVTF